MKLLTIPEIEDSLTKANEAVKIRCIKFLMHCASLLFSNVILAVWLALKLPHLIWISAIFLIAVFTYAVITFKSIMKQANLYLLNCPSCNQKIDIFSAKIVIASHTCNKCNKPIIKQV